MPRKSKRAKKEYLKNKIKVKDKRREVKHEDHIYLGKENVKRWTDFKIRFDFSTDIEFASYLLDLFAAEKSSSTDPKKAESKLLSVLPEDLEDNEGSTSKTTMNKNNHVEAENSSSVIVMNNTVKGGVIGDDGAFVPHGPVDDDDSVELSHNNSMNQMCESFVTCSQGLLPELQDQCSVSLNCSEVNTIHGSELTSGVEVCRNLPDSLNKTEEQQMHDTKSNISITGVKLRKHKKQKARSPKEDHLLTVAEKTFKHRKKKFKSFENKLSNTPLESPPQESVPEAEMKSEWIESESVAEQVEPVVCERVAITIRLCSDCELHHVQDACPLSKPIAVVTDAVELGEWKKGEEDAEPIKTFAEASLPSCLELKIIDSRHGPSVTAKEELQAFLQFGPLVGQEIKEMQIPDDSTMHHIWELSDSTSCSYLTTSDTNLSNWLRFVRPAPVRSSRNLEVLLRGGQLVFVTTTTIAAGEELLFWAENTNAAWSHKKLCKTKCGGCNLSFSHTLYYRLHCAVFHDPAYSLTVRKYHCKVCGLSVLGKENIVKHAADSHNGKGAYQCQFCHKFFLRLNYLEMHRTYGCSANPNRARPLCDYCGRKFCQPQKLKVHIKRMHSEMLEVLRDFQCKHCLKLLGSRAALQRHFKEVHQKAVVGAFTCDRCGKMFQNKSNLKIHMLTHSGVKPFKCKEPECSAAFTTKQCLQFHYRKIHGLEEACMPRIERSVEYTFDAYAGGRRPSSVNSDSQCSSEGEDSPEKYPNEEPPLSPPISVTSEQVDKPALDTFNKMVVSKGSKKWMGEIPDSSKTPVFDFDEDDKDQDINVSQIEEEPIPMLFHHCKQDSSNASLLVEAALTAAERDIDISSKVPSPMSLVTNKEVYPVLRSHLSQSPLSLSRPVSPVEYPVQDQSQSPHLVMESCYSTPMSPRHPYSLMFPERTPHYEFRLSPPPGQIDTFHLEETRYDQHHRRDENSGDEGVNVAQNLSLLKSKPLQLDIPYKYDSVEERSFECVEGLDMSRTSSYHHSFVSMTPRYPHALYEPRSYSHTDVLRVVNFSHSVDLSLPRSHHQLTPPMNQTMIEPIRIISPPPYQTYPLSTSPYSRPPHSPTYHHYNTTY